MLVGRFFSSLFGGTKASAPVKQSHTLPGVSRNSGAFRGALRDWRPLRSIVRGTSDRERELTADRVEDLFRNDGVTRSVVNSMTTNVVGKGLTAQSIIPYKRLGISQDQARDLQDQIEWLWLEWTTDAHYRGQYNFETLQSLAVRSLVRSGEFLHLPVMEKRPRSGCRFRLRIQDVDPRRLRTPYERLQDPRYHDGVEVNETGVPVAYWIMSPAPQVGYVDYSALGPNDYQRYPAVLNFGRKGIFHVFKADEEEQYRGTSALSPVVTFLRNFTDSIDNELLAQVIASSFPIFIELENGTNDLPDYVKEQDEGPDEERRYYQEVNGGQIVYGNKGEKPQVLENSRPSSNFQNFCTLLLRMIGASLELPYETITKDFSKTNYSSARAALLEAYRVYEVYRTDLVRQYCQPVFSMVIEEAFLSGLLDLPCTVSGFYRDRTLWTNARWVAPARGYIDPQKETNANIALIEAGLMSRSEAIAERGGDFDDVVQRLADEDAMIKKLRPDAQISQQQTQNAVNSTTDERIGAEDGQNSDENGENEQSGDEDASEDDRYADD